MNLRHASLLKVSLLATACFALEARATVWLLDNELTAASPTFTITGSSTNPLALFTGDHPYELFSFQLSEAATITVQLTGAVVGSSGALADPSLFIYQGSFGSGGYSPETLLPLLGANDDIVQYVNRNSSITLSLAANTTYTLVRTTWESDQGFATYGESQYGGIQTSIDTGASTATLTVIPEPRTYGLILSFCTMAVVAIRGWRRSFVRA